MKVAILGAGLLLLLPAGCARSAEERQLDSMREEIESLQRDRDRVNERSGLMTDHDEEAARQQESSRPGGREKGASPSDPVAVGFDGDPATDDAADTDDPAPRPSIRILGSPHPSGRGAWRGDDRVEQSGTVDGPSQGSGALDPAAKPAYDAALALVTAHKYPEALDALAAFLVRWPDHPYADNAMYWRGECYFAQGDYTRAAEQFDGVLTRFPAGNKAPDALLKLGMCAARTGDSARARELFARLARDYPQSAAARRIPPVASGVAPAGPAAEDHR
ncbi:MAG: tol-pal system protein YbgF [Polyangiaceae bacterium]